MVSIRAAGPADIPTIQAIAAAVWPVAYAEILSPAQLQYMLRLFYSEAALQKQLTEESHCFFLAMGVDRSAVGFASYSARSSTSIAHLHKLYVLPQIQGIGAGSALLRQCEKEATEHGAAAMQLNVNRRNRAKDFYERCGYRVVLEEDIAIGNGYFMNDYRMEKPLVGAKQTV